MSEVVEAPKKIWRETRRIEKQVLGKVGREIERVERKIEKGVKSIVPSVPEMPTIPPFPSPHIPSPRPQAVQLEAIREREREAMRRRRGYMSTITTRGGRGLLQTERPKAKTLGE